MKRALRRGLVGSAGLVLIAALSWPVYVAMSNTNQAKGTAVDGKKHVMLVGASVGKAWKLADFTRRTNDGAHLLESVAVYDFDKTEMIEEILMRPKRKFRLTKTYLLGFFKPAPQRPDAIILKECAAYFPGDLERYKGLMTKWVARIREAGIEVMVATVVPVTERRAGEQPGKIEGIRAYNDWVHEFAQRERIPVLDLEAAMATQDGRRFLRDEWTSGDGLHLNAQAYQALDQTLADLLAQRQRAS
jgi:hypothetical protein